MIVGQGDGHLKCHFMNRLRWLGAGLGMQRTAQQDDKVSTRGSANRPMIRVS